LKEADETSLSLGIDPHGMQCGSAALSTDTSSSPDRCKVQGARTRLRLGCIRSDRAPIGPTGPVCRPRHGESAPWAYVEPGRRRGGCEHRDHPATAGQRKVRDRRHPLPDSVAGTSGGRVHSPEQLADASFVTTVIDTTRRDPAGLARDAARLVTAAASNPDTQELPECSGGDVAIIIGPRAVGKSSVTWGVAMRRWASGERTVYVDLDQVGFLRPPPADASLQAANLGVIWRNALSRGANRLIANGMVTTNESLAILRNGVRPAPVRALRLAANPDTLWERIRARSTGGPARLINDDLENGAPDVQRRVHRVAVGQDVEYAVSNLGDDVIDLRASLSKKPSNEPFGADQHIGPRAPATRTSTFGLGKSLSRRCPRGQAEVRTLTAARGTAPG
jgi:hypothetical protein